MLTADIVAATAGLASIISFTPQAWKVIRTRDTSSLSAATYAITVLGFALWFTYGLMMGAWAIIVTNGVCGAIAAFILVMKLLPPAGKAAIADALAPAQDGPEG
jgi:MtN3 and saliva related transmembrane protein